MFTKKDLVSKVAEANQLSVKKASEIVESVFGALSEAVASGEKVQVFGFGTFEVKERAARTGRNPLTGETLEIAASKNVGFSAAKALKDAVNN